MISHLRKKFLFRDKKNLKDKIPENYAKITVIPKNPEKISLDSRFKIKRLGIFWIFTPRS